jgi:hypothetical protein
MMNRAISTSLLVACASGWVACHSMGPGFTVAPDGGTDADTDIDTDVDTDTDTATSIADSDGDWLSDQWEEDNGTNPEDQDSDGDGASDLVEHLAGTDPLDSEDNPWNNDGHLYFLMPFEGDPQPAEDRQIFATNINKADFFVLADTTGTMVQPINQLKTALTGTIVPAVADLVPDMWYGLGRFDDYPVSPYGFSPDVVYELRLRTTDNIETLEAAINALNTPRPPARGSARTCRRRPSVPSPRSATPASAAARCRSSCSSPTPCSTTPTTTPTRTPRSRRSRPTTPTRWPS